MVSDRRHVCLYEHNKSVHVGYNRTGAIRLLLFLFNSLVIRFEVLVQVRVKVRNFVPIFELRSYILFVSFSPLLSPHSSGNLHTSLPSARRPKENTSKSHISMVLKTFCRKERGRENRIKYKVVEGNASIIGSIPY